MCYEWHGYAHTWPDKNQGAHASEGCSFTGMGSTRKQGVRMRLRTSVRIGGLVCLVLTETDFSRKLRLLPNTLVYLLCLMIFKKCAEKCKKFVR